MTQRIVPASVLNPDIGPVLDLQSLKPVTQNHTLTEISLRREQ